MSGLLADADFAALVVVTVPEELPVRETQDALAELAAEPLAAIGAVTVNRLLPAPDVSASDLPPGPHREAALLHAGLFADQREWLAELPGDVRLPYLFGMLTPGEVAARLADVWSAA